MTFTKLRLRRTEGIGLDIKLGLRMLRRSWGLTLTGGLAMAAAIGIGATVFAVVKAYEGDTLPFEQGDRVVRLMTVSRNGGPTSAQDFERWRAGLRSVVQISAAWMGERLLVTRDGAGERVAVAQMSASGFQVARVRPQIGRPLLEEDERSGAAPVAVLGYDTWQSRTGGSGDALGMTVQIGGTDHVVVGVMPKGFGFPLHQQVWIPLPAGNPGPANADVVVFGRLAPGIAIETAQAELSALGPARQEAVPADETRTRILPYARSFVRIPSWWTAIPFFVALLLVPPCANIAILIYARNVSRQSEFAARYMLGAGRGRIVGQLLIEAFVLAGAAAGLGLVVARLLLGLFQSHTGQEPGFPFWLQPSLSFETVLFMAGLTAFAAMVAGGVPALRATGRMRQAGFHALGSRTSARLGATWTALVVAQVALTTAALPQFGKGIWMFLNPLPEGRPFAADQYVTARIAADAGPDVRSGVARNLPEELSRRIRTDLGVAAVTVSESIDGIDESVDWLDTDTAGSTPVLAGANRVDKAYFDVYQAPLLTGRMFDSSDFVAGRAVVLIDRQFAESFHGNPLGKRLRTSAGRRTPAGPWHEIVGIVERVSPSAQRPFVYYPMPRDGSPRLSLTLRVGAAARPALARGLVSIVRTVDPALQVNQLRALDGVYSDERREENAFGLGFSGVLLLVLLFSAAGIHTLVAFAVAQRRHEIGIRAALGASPLRLVGGVFRADLTPVAAGALLGALLSIPIDLYSESSAPLVSAFSAVAALAFMLAVGFLSVAGPASRVLRVDATEALRGD